jgi:flagellar biosynthesis chaperone FliJ
MAAKNKGLTSLIRLADANLNEKRRALSELERQEDELRQRLDALEVEKFQEQQNARTMEFVGAVAYSGYARGVIERRERIEAQIAAMQPMLEEARQAMSEAFQDFKRYEIALDLRVKAAKAEAERKDTIALDEISLNMHRRKQAAQ